MPIIRVGWDERYPDYYISTDLHDPMLEVTEVELAAIKAADEAYSNAQKILGRARRRK